MGSTDVADEKEDGFPCNRGIARMLKSCDSNLQMLDSKGIKCEDIKVASCLLLHRKHGQTLSVSINKRWDQTALQG